MVGAQFSRVRPSKNQSRDRLRTTTARGNVKNRFRRRLRKHFFGPGPVFDRFLASAGSQNEPKNCFLAADAEARERNFWKACLNLQAEGPPNAKHDPKRPKIDRKVFKKRSKSDRTIRHGMLAKCRTTLPKIKHKLRGETLASYLQG